ncbi:MULTISPECIES: winged helix-turn-helix domain-containing protein [Niastella]|uniref:Winged helix-turn-helix transcriptional regulator n=1 Tax=Niastella soli TaxID=2821487 RepID=A0ABS3YYM0_9BACT|nr:winged helix-turn-helix domain-containing protein [Niastella soli]MBO9202587.1 winged helix-turn-helix transcriptional regulator [Niastella soli]
MSWKSLLAIGISFIVIVSWAAIHGRAALPATDKATEKLVIRQIGHQLLLQAGDSSSRVLPVEERANKEYLIRFAAPFTFLPDTLVATVRRLIAANSLPSSYLVEVIHCAPSAEVIYGFQIHKDKARNVIPCLGRQQEKACYNIRIRFTETKAAGMDPFASGLLAGSLVAILISLLFRALYLRKGRTADKAVNMPALDNSTGITMEITGLQNIQPDLPPSAIKREVPAPSGIAIGNLLFLPESQQLIAGTSIIPLTAKEAKLLHVFANAQQKVIDRDQLLKEVWEDEGVIVGRSLDMFVSKLRKKLQADPSVSILNVHGKGYKLVIGQMTC